MKIVKHQEKSNINYSALLSSREWISNNRIELAEPQYAIVNNISRRGWNQMLYYWTEYEIL